jgi:hypothetical protein
MFELYPRNCPTGQRDNTGATLEPSTRPLSYSALRATVPFVLPQGSSLTRFATWATRVVAEHAQNAPEDSVESLRDIVFHAHAALNVGNNLAPCFSKKVRRCRRACCSPSIRPLNCATDRRGARRRGRASRRMPRPADRARQTAGRRAEDCPNFSCRSLAMVNFICSISSARWRASALAF